MVWCHIWHMAHLSADVLGTSIQDESKVVQQGCWVFNHMVKSGGSTIKRLLHKFSKLNQVRRQEFANKMWLQGSKGRENGEEIIQENSGLVFGGYAEGLRATGGSDDCKWFTIFRHPVSRLVSAYFYCKFVNRKDPLCAQHTIDLDTIDLESFAEHWGNYGLRQFVLGFVPTDEILTSFAARECDGCPGWYIVKQHLETSPHWTLNNTSGASPSASPMHSHSLNGYLGPAREIISSGYAAVGILEDIETTMRLFDSALGMPNFNWTVESSRQGAVNVDNQRKDEEDAVLLQASTNPAVQEFIWLDLVLYEHARSVHAKQVGQYGLQ